AMLADKTFGDRIDPKRVGAAGFALGGYTTLLLAGAQSDISDFYDVCVPGGPANRLDIDTSICNMPEARSFGTPLEALRRTRATSAESLAYSGQSFEDDGIRAVFAIAPALAFTLDEDSLRSIHIPVELVTGKLDRIDPKRVGAAGFSLGGYTTLLLAGAQSDISDFYDVCVPGGPANRLDIDTAICNIPEARAFGTPLEALRRTRTTSAESLAYSGQSFEDDGIRAVFAIAPALAFTLDEDSLRSIHIPVELVTGKLDRIAAVRDNADYIHAMVHGSREEVLPNVGHYTFLDACTPAGRETLKDYCSDAPGLEREAIHRQVADMAIKFFQHELR
ncbi:MAG: alpha/beta fold hydrolase, partial [Bryocella sp.]